jgi:hypothetical protein
LPAGAKFIRGGIAPLAVALVVCASAAAGDPPAGHDGSRQPLIATSGNKSELIKRVPIRRRPGRGERVAMRISQGALEPIESGDRLRASAEVQVSTTCIEPGPRCIGHSYRLSPIVTAQIVLSRSHRARSRHLALSRPTHVLCKQHRPNRNHHCTLTIPNTMTAIDDPAALPCPPRRCYVHLLLSAHNPKARHGDFIVLGGDRPDGTLEQDKGRLSVVQLHADARALPPVIDEALLHRRLPLTISNADKRRVVYSVPIFAPERGDVIAFDATFVSAISALPFNTFISSRVILATTPFKKHPHQKAKTAIRYRGQATESNGFDCTLGPSGYANPCITHKAGAIRFRRDLIERKTGQPVTLYLNVLAAAKPLLAETKVKQVNKVSLAAQPGGLTVWRYQP